jgi:hypothetical protein
MKNLIARLFRYKWTGIAFALSLTLVLAGWIWAWVRLRGSSSLTLHFSAYTGINRVGSLSDLHTFGFLGLLMLALNWLIAMSFEERDWFLGKLTAFAGLALGILIFIGFMVIMNVN